MPDLSPDLLNEIREFGEELVERFTPPEFIPGCAVKVITDKDLYATDNGWIECLVSQHNQQRCRWRGQVPNIQVNDIVDVMYFKSYRLFVVFGQGGVGAQTQNILHKFDATTAPTANEDSGDGYSVGSQWLDVTNDKFYICVDATATAAVWLEPAATGGSAGSMDFIEEQVLSVAAASIVLGGSTAIPGTYEHLKIFADLRSVQNFLGTGDGLLMHFNNDTGNNYATSSSKIINGTSSLTTANLTAPALHLGEIDDASSFATLIFSPVEILIADYAITTKNTSVKSETLLQGGSVTKSGPTWGGGQWILTPRVAITKITLKTSSANNLDAGSTVRLYGLKNS